MDSKNIIFKLENEKKILLDFSKIKLKEISWKKLVDKFDVFVKQKIKFDKFGMNLTYTYPSEYIIKDKNQKIISHKKDAEVKDQEFISKKKINTL